MARRQRWFLDDNRKQLRATVGAGGVTGVTLKRQGGGFLVEIATCSGQRALLVKVRTTEPRCFGNPTSALIVLRDVGINVIQLDATDWSPDQKDMSRSRQSRSGAPQTPSSCATDSQEGRECDELTSGCVNCVRPDLWEAAVVKLSSTRALAAALATIILSCYGDKRRKIFNSPMSIEAGRKNDRSRKHLSRSQSGH